MTEERPLVHSNRPCLFTLTERLVKLTRRFAFLSEKYVFPCIFNSFSLARELPFLAAHRSAGKNGESRKRGKDNEKHDL